MSEKQIQYPKRSLIQLAIEQVLEDHAEEEGQGLTAREIIASIKERELGPTLTKEEEKMLKSTVNSLLYHDPTVERTTDMPPKYRIKEETFYMPDDPRLEALLDEIPFWESEDVLNLQMGDEGDVEEDKKRANYKKMLLHQERNMDGTPEERRLKTLNDLKETIADIKQTQADNEEFEQEHSSKHQRVQTCLRCGQGLAPV